MERQNITDIHKCPKCNIKLTTTYNDYHYKVHCGMCKFKGPSVGNKYKAVILFHYKMEHYTMDFSVIR